MKTYYVYLMTNHNRTLYIGVTSELTGRVSQHRKGTGSKFTSKYKINQLVYYEEFSNIEEAILRKKQIKGWLREKKIKLIESSNPNWQDLSVDWFNT